MANFIQRLNWSRQEWILAGLVFAFLVYVIFNEIYKYNWRKKLESQLSSINERIGSGRANANELVELKLRKQAILQEALKGL